jgi:hypothetical protein
MMSDVPLETCWDFNKRWNNKFYYKVAFCWLFILIHTTMHGSMNINFQVLFTRLHPGTHLTRINCQWKLCSLINKLSPDSVRLIRASWWFSIQIPFSKHKKVAPQKWHLTSGDYTRFGSSVSNGSLRISLVCCCNRFEVSALHECDAASLSNWFPTFRDDEGF